METAKIVYQKATDDFNNDSLHSVQYGDYQGDLEILDPPGQMQGKHGKRRRVERGRERFMGTTWQRNWGSSGFWNMQRDIESSNLKFGQITGVSYIREEMYTRLLTYAQGYFEKSSISFLFSFLLLSDFHISNLCSCFPSI